MGIVLWVMFGILAGSLARLVMPGPRAGGFAVSLPLGIGGAVIGGMLSVMFGIGSAMEFDFRSLLMAITGSLLLLFSYRSFAMRAVA